MSAPTLLFIVGPPAVGKMTVGHEIAERTGFRLLHNHVTIEPVLRLFDFGTPPYQRLVSEFRRLLVTEAAASDLPGLLFTFVWAFDLASDRKLVKAYARPFRRRGGRVLCLELRASQEERLSRAAGEFRLAEKPSRRDVEESRRSMLRLDARHRLQSAGELDGPDYLLIDNTRLPPPEAAGMAIAHFGLPVLAAPPA